MSERFLHFKCHKFPSSLYLSFKLFSYPSITKLFQITPGLSESLSRPNVYVCGLDMPETHFFFLTFSIRAIQFADKYLYPIPCLCYLLVLSFIHSLLLLLLFSINTSQVTSHRFTQFRLLQPTHSVN